MGHTLQLTDLLDEPHCLNRLDLLVSGEIDTSAERRGGGGVREGGREGKGGEREGRGRGGEREGVEKGRV